MLQRPHASALIQRSLPRRGHKAQRALTVAARSVPTAQRSRYARRSGVYLKAGIGPEGTLDAALRCYAVCTNWF